MVFHSKFHESEVPINFVPYVYLIQICHHIGLLIDDANAATYLVAVLEKERVPWLG